MRKMIAALAIGCLLVVMAGCNSHRKLGAGAPALTTAQNQQPASQPPGSNAEFIFTHSYSLGHSYRIHIPGAWQGKYSVKETEDMVTFYFYKPVYYNVRPGSEQKAPGACDPIFGIDMLTNNQWEKEKQGPGGYGIELASRDGLVFVLTPSIVNDYDGQDAIEYGEMANDAWLKIGKTFELVNGRD